MSEPSLIDITNDDELMERVMKKSAEMQKKILEKEKKEYVEVEVTTREYDHAEAIKRATENLCGEEEE